MFGRERSGLPSFPQWQDYTKRASGVVLATEIDVTTAQMIAMGSTPLELVPAVPGFAILPIYIWIDMDVAVAFGNSAQPLVQWPGQSPPVWHSLFVLPTNNPGRVVAYVGTNVFISISGSTMPYGAPMQMVYLGGAGADLTGAGSFTRDTRINVSYSLVATP